MFLIAGLGNPGREYKETRHNIGFIALDHISEKMNIPIRKYQAQALIGKGVFSSENVVLVKPQTYMNLSGVSVSQLVRFYKVPLENVLIIHDDLDLPLGTLRIRPSGGSGGQKGLKSILERLGTQDVARMRIGIGRPPGTMNSASYVLKKFHSSEEDLLSIVLQNAQDAVKSFIEEGIQMAMNKFNGNYEND